MYYLQRLYANLRMRLLNSVNLKLCSSSLLTGLNQCTTEPRIWTDYSQILKRVPEELESSFLPPPSLKYLHLVWILLYWTVPLQVVMTSLDTPSDYGGVLKNLQHAIGAPERCSMPVIAAVNDWCIGPGMDIISSFGTLAYLPNITFNESLARGLVFTMSSFDATTAVKVGLVSKVVDDGLDAIVLLLLWIWPR